MINYSREANIVTEFTRILLVFLAVAFIITAPGCCKRQGKQPESKADKTSQKGPVDKAGINKDLITEENNEKVAITGSPDLVSRRKARVKALYRRLENSFEMFKKGNLDAALREVERVKLETDNDPHLDMQAWYLSAMIYHKAGKSSRRKRAMRKMLESMEQLQQDPRFRKAYEDGILGRELVDIALKQGEGKYVE